ncbi:MAG TPA: hypothetical protein VJA21_17090 [Verrucomicrobiae bacterium]
MKTLSHPRGVSIPGGTTKRETAAPGRWYHGGVLSCVTLLPMIVLISSCGSKVDSPPRGATDPHLATNGTVEVTARLLEIPEGAIFKRDLYDYATALKYQVLKVQRGEIKTKIIYVGHYNPWKPRSEAADRRVQKIGGDLRRFQAGQVHHLALELPIEDFFMGGIVNKYFGQSTDPIYWAIWTNLEGQ